MSAGHDTLAKRFPALSGLILLVIDVHRHNNRIVLLIIVIIIMTPVSEVTYGPGVSILSGLKQDIPLVLLLICDLYWLLLMLIFFFFFLLLNLYRFL